MVKNGLSKDLAGNRTLFDCHQFRVPELAVATEARGGGGGGGATSADLPSESCVTRKRPMPQEPTTDVAKK